MQKIVKQEKEEKAKHVVVLYLLFPVMESSTTAVSNQESRAQTPTQDEDERALLTSLKELAGV